MQTQELTFQVDGLRFAAQAWGDPTHYPVLALHGWLDNSASFSALAPLLSDVYIVAIDMAGHGQTSHRPGSFPYNIWEDVTEIFAIADQLGWKEFALLGHSRGGIIATLAAGTFPDRIIGLGLIEGLFPEPASGADAPDQLAASIKGLKTATEKTLSVYPNLSTAIKLRQHGMFPLSYAAAKLLTERGIKKTSGGYQWSTDQRLLAPSAVKFVPEQVTAFITRIACPVRLVLAESGLPRLFPFYLDAVNAYPHILVTTLAGGHHLHMEEQVIHVASVFDAFFVKKN